MLEDLSAEARKARLKLHMRKTKILSNLPIRKGVLPQPAVKVEGQDVEVLPYHDGTMYLGRYVTFNDFHDAEIKHRMSKAWAAFAKNKGELCGRHYPLRARLKLFDASVLSQLVDESVLSQLLESMELCV